VSFSVLFVCTCTVLLPPGDYPFAVNKYIISYNFEITSEKVKEFFCPIPHDFQKSISFGKFLGFALLAFLVRATCRWDNCGALVE